MCALFSASTLAAVVEGSDADFAYYQLDRAAQKNGINLANSIYIHTEKNGTLSWQTVHELGFSDWVPGRRELTKLPSWKESHWIKAKISIADIDELNWILHNGNGKPKKSELFILIDGELQSHFSSNLDNKLSERLYRHRYIAYPIEMKPNSEMEILVRIEGNNTIAMPFV
ncbi:MAG: hypothetical protein O7F71_15390 [Gammaproteobacteria bacterium]|nr:hypothetical protein [Gammaproteobacteria bacterium]